MFTERFANLTPYTPGEQPRDMKYIKLNTNENPYPPSPGITDFLKSMDIEQLRLYPDPSSLRLRRTIAEHYGVDAENVFTGNGSDEVLSFCYYAFFESSRGQLLFPEHSYSFYPVYAEYYGIDYFKVPLNRDFSINLEAFLEKETATGVIFPNPNAPTGMCIGLREIDSFLSKFPKNRVVVIDEAYVDFGADSAVPLIRKYRNLLIVQTFSKSRSLAGARLGYAIGDGALIRALNIVKDSFNSYPVDAITQELGILAIKDTAHFEKTITAITAVRNEVSTALQNLGWEVLPSKSNFIFTRKDKVSGKKVYEWLKAEGILVRHFNHPGIEDFIRITIGRKHDMKAFLDLIADYMQTDT